MSTNSVYIVDGSRSPFLKARGRPGPFQASDFAVQSATPLLMRQPFEPEEFDEVIVGCVGPSADEVNIARVISLRLGCGDKVPAWTVQRNCASGMQSIDSAFSNILLGKSDLVLAGGAEAMSHSPVLYNHHMVNWLADMNRSKTPLQKLKTITQLRPKFFTPVIGLLKGLTDPVVGLSMGQTAENLAHMFNISREEMDQYAVDSHLRLVYAQENDLFDNEIVNLYDDKGKTYNSDDGVRPDSSLEKLAKLRPVFDKKHGNITAGNSAQITDGASWVILASEQAVKKHNLNVMGRLVASNWAALDPRHMGLGPVHSTVPMLQAQNLNVNDIDYWELNEAFAAQVLGCLAAWKDPHYCQEHLGLDKAFGEVPHEKLNVDGGAISMGHPVGASGTRIVHHVLNVLKRNKAKLGVATICIGGGQGGAMLVENLQ
ncbi:MAG: acetyl-CoA C-acetyltransferase [Gammaproteobacteria bacterium]|nr:MAG: acetyl-CoA C-acetyltransferase [Gammaproteobacteria bacterium]